MTLICCHMFGSMFALERKSPVNFSPITTAFTRLMFTHQIDFFGKPDFSPSGMLHPEIFTPARKWQRFGGAHPTRDGVAPTIFFQRGSKFGLKRSVCSPVTLELRGVASRSFTTWCATK